MATPPKAAASEKKPSSGRNKAPRFPTPPEKVDRNAPESDSDDSAALDELEEEAQEEFNTMRSLLRSGRSKRGGKKRENSYAPFGRSDSKIPKL